MARLLIRDLQYKIEMLNRQLTNAYQELKLCREQLAASDRSVTVLLHEALKHDTPSVLTTEGISSGATLKTGREHKFIETYLL